MTSSMPEADRVTSPPGPQRFFTFEQIDGEDVITFYADGMEMLRFDQHRFWVRAHRVDINSAEVRQVFDAFKAFIEGLDRG